MPGRGLRRRCGVLGTPMWSPAPSLRTVRGSLSERARVRERSDRSGRARRLAARRYAPCGTAGGCGHHDDHGVLLGELGHEGLEARRGRIGSPSSRMPAMCRARASSAMARASSRSLPAVTTPGKSGTGTQGSNADFIAPKQLPGRARERIASGAKPTGPFRAWSPCDEEEHHGEQDFRNKRRERLLAGVRKPWSPTVFLRNSLSLKTLLSLVLAISSQQQRCGRTEQTPSVRLRTFCGPQISFEISNPAANEFPS
jgi:hypothetical protein